jgi:hypothetical protein
MNIPDEVMARIKMEYQRTHEALNIYTIKHITKSICSNGSDLEWILKLLIKKGDIERNGELFKPTNIAYYRNITNSDAANIVKEENILWTLRNFGRLKPSECAELYMSTFGPVNTESLTRIMRFMFADGKINRDGDVYYAEGFENLKEKSLSFFSKE